MRQCTLKVNDEFSYLGAKYSVHSIKPPKISFIRTDFEDKRVLEFDYMTLITDPSFEPEKLMQRQAKSSIRTEEKRHRSILDTLSPKHRENVSKRFEMIKPALVFERAKNGDFVSTLKFNDAYREFIKESESVFDLTKEELLKRISKKFKKSVRTLKRY